VLCLPRSACISPPIIRILQVWNGAQTESRQVTIGLRGDSNVEILSGLQEGEKVVVR
jgi:multidrug efflux pump subunit AcrA (membrane-fusion protein)